MKKSKAQSLLDRQIQSLGETLSALLFESRFAVTEYRSTVAAFTKKLEEAKEDKRARNLDKNAILVRSMWQRAPARDVRSASIHPFMIGLTSARDDQLLQHLEDYINQQHLWLLVSAFEAYEQFFKDLYGCIGFLDKFLWRCGDFGDISIPQVGKKDITWYLNQSNNKIARHNIDNILKHLRQVWPNFSEHETEHQPDLLIRIGLATTLRHIIVHSRGIVDLDEFFEILGRNTGRSFQGSKSAPTRKRISDRYLREEDDGCHIQAIERNKLAGPFSEAAKPTTALLEDLASHACLAYAHAMMHFGKTPFWERPKSNNK